MRSPPPSGAVPLPPLLAFPAASLTAADALPPPRPPLGTPTQGPLRELFLDETGAEPRRSESSELTLRYSIANSWNEAMSIARGPSISSQEMDEQADSLTVRYRAPWSRWLGPKLAAFSTTVEGRFTVHWGGYTDRGIEAWHGLVGAFNYERSRFPHNQVHLALGDEGGSAFQIDGATP